MQHQVQGPTLCLCRPHGASEGQCTGGPGTEGHSNHINNCHQVTDSPKDHCGSDPNSQTPCCCGARGPCCRGPSDFSQSLPTEMSEHIFVQLDAQSLCRAAQTCKRWHHIIEDSDRVWRGQCLRLRAHCHRELERDRGHGLSWKVTLVRNYTRSRLKRDWLRGRFSVVLSSNELRDVRMVPLDAESWGEILEAELDR